MRKDTDEQHKAFVHMVDPLSSEVTYACQFPRLPNSIYKWFHLNISVVILCPEKNRFVRSPCPSRHVLYLRCSHLGGLHCSILRIAFGERYFSRLVAINRMWKKNKHEGAGRREPRRPDEWLPVSIGDGLAVACVARTSEWAWM